jgi:hypothetical protein
MEVAHFCWTSKSIFHAGPLDLRVAVFDWPC